MKVINYCFYAILLLIVFSCSSIPTKVPELIEVSSNNIEEQTTTIIAEWEASIATNISAQKLLELIYKNKDQIQNCIQENESKIEFSNFIKGYTIVQKQLNNSILQKDRTQILKKNIETILSAIKTANSYIAESVDENARVNALIETIKSLKNKGADNE